MDFNLERLQCKVCHTQNLIKFISFGKMPVANAFIAKEDLEKEEYTYDMEVGFCENCKMTQLIDIVPYDKYIVPDEYNQTQYAFFSSTSKAMQEHFAAFAQELEDRFMEENSQAMDIGSNDGILLKGYRSHKVLGVEPSSNVAKVAQDQGIETIVDFFTEQLARQIVAEKGKFRAITSTNVFLNVIDIHSFMKGITTLLDDKGVFVTEDPYIVDILEKTSYDQIYDEHIWYFSLTALSNLYEMHGMEIFDAERQWVHGGSMRIYACRKGAHPKTERLQEYIRLERDRKIAELEPYLVFAENTQKSRNELKTLLEDLKAQNKKIVGYAAASKGTIVLNYCDVGKETLEYISDSTPFKQGKYSPGKKIPVVSPEHFRNDQTVDYALLGAWNHADEIMKKEQDFLKRGGKFIVHYPQARILEPKILEQVPVQEAPKQENSFPGVEIKQLKLFVNDQGYLFDTIRNDDELFDGEYGQTLISVVNPGVIKGLHRHEKLTDYTTCVKGNIKYVLAKENPDGTADIKTFIIGEKNPILIKVPPGYWHGYTPLANEQAFIVHIGSKAFDPKDPDTDRVDPFHFGDPWTVKHG